VTVYTPMTDRQRSNVQQVIDDLTEVGKAIGGWTDKYECRQTGISYHAKFDNEVDVLTVTTRFARQLSEAPAMLADACRRLLDADAAVQS
jgi:hypothetical protein